MGLDGTVNQFHMICIPTDPMDRLRQAVKIAQVASPLGSQWGALLSAPFFNVASLNNILGYDIYMCAPKFTNSHAWRASWAKSGTTSRTLGNQEP